MKTTEEFIEQFKNDFESELHHYFLSESDIDKKYHYISACTYERILKKMGMSEEEKNEIVEKARRAFAEVQQFPKEVSVS